MMHTYSTRSSLNSLKLIISVDYEIKDRANLDKVHFLSSWHTESFKFGHIYIKLDFHAVHMVLPFSTQKRFNRRNREADRQPTNAAHCY